MTPTAGTATDSPAATRRLVALGRQTIRVDQRPGVGDVPLLLCNGIGANLELWDPFVAEVGRPTIAFDAPGVGGSSVPVYPPTMRWLGRLVGRLLDEMGVDRVDVLGLSWGGALAQQLAHVNPTRVRRLVLAGTTAGWTAVPGSPKVLSRLLSTKRYRSPEYLESIAAELYGGEVRQHPEWLREHGHQRYVRQAGTRGYLWQLLAGRRWTSLPWLHRLAQRTLVLSGDDDPIIPLVNARLLAGRIPRADLHVVPGGGHLFLLTRADKYGPMVTRFLADPADAASPGVVAGPGVVGSPPDPVHPAEDPQP